MSDAPGVHPENKPVSSKQAKTEERASTIDPHNCGWAYPAPLVHLGHIVRRATAHSLLAGGIASGVQVTISIPNTSGAWDNAKKC